LRNPEESEGLPRDPDVRGTDEGLSLSGTTGDEVAEPTSGKVADEICRNIQAIQRDSYGGGAERIQAHVLDDTVVVLLDGLELLPNEEFLIEHDREDVVNTVREQFQEAIGATFSAAVERSTGRRVIGFASHVTLQEPRFAVEIFRLEPH
jgi:uncharacterized protein YbcI